MTDIFPWLSKRFASTKALSNNVGNDVNLYSYWDMRAMIRCETSSAVTFQNYSHAATS